jgi:limonene-1,2-epoxide hydrolase
MSEGELPSEVVNRLFAAWRKPVDPATIAGMFTVDGVWHNMMNEPLVGRDQIEHALTAMTRDVDDVEFRVLTWASNGHVLLVERVDWIAYRDGARVGLPVTGVFEIADGQIASWRDYYDSHWLREETAKARSAAGGSAPGQRA